LATAGSGATALGGGALVVGAGAIAGSAAFAAAVPVIGWAVGGAVLLGVGTWGAYKLLGHR
jgi:polygalacturonase